MKILCIGQSAYDITLPVKEFPDENRKYKIKEKYECGGGSSNNAAYLLALWGCDVYLASSIGKDVYGKKIKDELLKVGVNITYFEELPIPTTTSYIINNLSNGSRTIITNKDPRIHFNNSGNITMPFDIIFLDGNDFEMSLKVIEDNPNAIKIIDAGSIKDGVIELCKKCDYVVCSNDFAREYSKIDFKCNELEKVKSVYNRLKEDFKGTLVITLEENGSITKIDNEFVIVPSIKVDAIDSTGAGDIYHGAFTYFITHNYSLLDTLKYSNIAGALSVTKIGSKNSMPNKDEVINYHGLY